MLVSFLKHIFLTSRREFAQPHRPARRDATEDKPVPGDSALPDPERRLHIGGTHVAEGWEIFNSVANEIVDHLGDAADLSRFPDATFDQIYASHILEHLDYKDALEAGLTEWLRVLKPGGVLMVAVPDLAALSRLLLTDDLSIPERFHVVRMIFGGHMDQYDYHVVGFDFELLVRFLELAGFVEMERVTSFGLFNDCSEIIFKSTRISLNVIARKPSDFNLRHATTQHGRPDGLD